MSENPLINSAFSTRWPYIAYPENINSPSNRHTASSNQINIKHIYRSPASIQKLQKASMKVFASVFVLLAFATSQAIAAPAGKLPSQFQRL